MINEFDSLIAGAMASNGCSEIVTSNVKDFGKIRGIKVLQAK